MTASISAPSPGPSSMNVPSVSRRALQPVRWPAMISSPRAPGSTGRPAGSRISVPRAVKGRRPRRRQPSARDVGAGATPSETAQPAGCATSSSIVSVKRCARSASAASSSVPSSSSSIRGAGPFHALASCGRSSTASACSGPCSPMTRVAPEASAAAQASSPATFSAPSETRMSIPGARPAAAIQAATCAARSLGGSGPAPSQSIRPKARIQGRPTGMGKPRRSRSSSSA